MSLRKSPPTLKLIPLGGTLAVNKNLYVYEFENSIIVIDCGIGFPESQDFGVDVVIPDFSYLLKNKDKVKGVLITHGHEDHFGALPFLLRELNVPVYSTRLVSGFIRNKLSEFKLGKGISLKTFCSRDIINLGPFKITPFSVNHSVPDSLGFVIECPAGKVVHAADFKFDWTPVMDRPFDIAKLAKVCETGVDVLLSDCLGSTSEGYTASEKQIEDTFNDLFSKAQKQLIVTTVSSNISRIQQAINSSIKHGRQVVFSGKSVVKNVEVAKKLGYLNIPKNAIVPEEDSKRYPQEKLTFIVAGSYGQTNSALYRIATEDHKHIKIEKGATVVFSADPNPPGVLDAVNYVIDKLTLLGAEVIYSEIQDNLHVSGHGSKGDISMLAGIVRPNYSVPIGGTVKYMRAFKNLMVQMGFPDDSVFELLEGETLILRNGRAYRGEKVNVGNVYVDGTGIGDVGSVVLRDRRELAESGIVVVAIPYKGDKGVFLDDIEIVSRGFVYMKQSRKLISDTEKLVRKILRENKGRSRDLSFIKGRVEKQIAKFLFKKTEREPIVLAVVVEV